MVKFPQMHFRTELFGQANDLDVNKRSLLLLLYHKWCTILFLVSVYLHDVVTPAAADPMFQPAGSHRYILSARDQQLRRQQQQG